MTVRRRKLTQGLFVAGTMALLIVLSFGIRAWLTRIRDVPDRVLSSIHGTVSAVIPYQRSLWIEVYNGSAWTIQDMTVELTAGRERRKYRSRTYGLGPLESGAIDIESDEAFIGRWRLGNVTPGDPFSDYMPGKWRIVSATGRPGG
jgi:hypothetical protein